MKTNSTKEEREKSIQKDLKKEKAILFLCIAKFHISTERKHPISRYAEKRKKGEKTTNRNS